MWNPFLHDAWFGPAGTSFTFGAAFLFALFVVMALWSITWKALGLWHAARNNQRFWFAAILIFNTVGVLEIIYLAWFGKNANAEHPNELFPFMKGMRAELSARMQSSAPEKEVVVKVVEKSGPEEMTPKEKNEVN